MITVRGFFGSASVPCRRIQDWAVHAQVGIPGLYAITLVPAGLCLPQLWASFDDHRKAIAAARAIARMRNDWHRIEQADLTPALGARLKAICARYGAVQGPNAFTAEIDRDKYGAPLEGRLNGYVGAF